MSALALLGLAALAGMELAIAALLGGVLWVLWSSGPEARNRGYGRRARQEPDVYDSDEDEESEPEAEGWQAVGASYCDRENVTTPHVWHADGSRRCISCKHESVGGTDDV